MRNLCPGPNGALLGAICHERRAIRKFRFDRIDCIIDMDGEVHEPTPFFHRNLGIDPNMLVGPSNTDLQTARALRDFLRPALSVLVIAAHCDDEFHAEELEAICCYIEDEVPHLEEMGKFTTPVTVEVLNELTALVRAMRPQRSSLAGYLQAIASQRPERRIRLENALVEVIRADGEIRLSEEAFMSDVSFLNAKNIADELAKARTNGWGEA